MKITDKERLDFIIKECKCINGGRLSQEFDNSWEFEFPGIMWIEAGRTYCGKTAREAIDRAIEARESTGRP